jgi:hypothetical protein
VRDAEWEDLTRKLTVVGIVALFTLCAGLGWALGSY